MANEQDYSQPIESLNDVQVDSEMSSIRSDADFQKGVGSVIGGNKRAAFLQDRLTALYQKKYPETEERKAELPEAKSLHDTIIKTGLMTSEEIAVEGEEGRQKIADEADILEAHQAETQLKIDLGAEAEPTVNTARFILDKVVSEKDREMIIEKYGNHVDFIEWLGRAGEFFDFGDEARKYRRPKGDEK